MKICSFTLYTYTLVAVHIPACFLTFLVLLYYIPIVCGSVTYLIEQVLGGGRRVPGMVSALPI